MISGRLLSIDSVKKEQKREDNSLGQRFALPSISNRPKVLIVDDEPHILRLLSLSLRNHFDIMTANTPYEAIYKARLENPNIILSDIMMPTMSGHELCNELQNYRETKHIPFLFLTAIDNPEQKMLSLKTTATDYLTKPFDANNLIKKINSSILF